MEQTRISGQMFGRFRVQDFESMKRNPDLRVSVYPYWSPPANQYNYCANCGMKTSHWVRYYLRAIIRDKEGLVNLHHVYWSVCVTCRRFCHVVEDGKYDKLYCHIPGRHIHGNPKIEKRPNACQITQYGHMAHVADEELPPRNPEQIERTAPWWSDGKMDIAPRFFFLAVGIMVLAFLVMMQLSYPGAIRSWIHEMSR